HMLMPSIASHHVAATVLLGAPRANLSQFAAAPKPSAQGSPQESRGNGSPGRSERSAACPGRAGLRDSGVAPPGLGGRAERPQRGDGAGVGPMADDPMTGGQGADEEGLRQRLVETRSTVEGLLKQQQAEQALAEALRHPPYGGSEETKDAKAGLRHTLRPAAEDASIKKAVGSLGEEDCVPVGGPDGPASPRRTPRRTPLPRAPRRPELSTWGCVGHVLERLLVRHASGTG
ncbi:unnamed protein product, partial [Prorocentrum cordatum]